MAKKEVSQAAEKVAAAEKKNNKKPANPNGNFFVRAGKAIKKFCKDLRGEIKKIVWPDAKTVFKSTAIVLLVVLAVGLVIFGIDTGLSEGIAFLEGLAEKRSVAEAATQAAAAISLGAEQLFLG